MGNASEVLQENASEVLQGNVNAVLRRSVKEVFLGSASEVLQERKAAHVRAHRRGRKGKIGRRRRMLGAAVAKMQRPLVEVVRLLENPANVTASEVGANPPA